MKPISTQKTKNLSQSSSSLKNLNNLFWKFIIGKNLDLDKNQIPRKSVDNFFHNRIEEQTLKLHLKLNLLLLDRGF